MDLVQKKIQRMNLELTKTTFLLFLNQEKEKESMDSTKWGVAICTVDGQRCVEVISDLSSHSFVFHPKHTM